MCYPCKIALYWVILLTCLSALYPVNADEAALPTPTDWQEPIISNRPVEWTLGPTGASITLISKPAEDPNNEQYALRVKTIEKGTPADGVLKTGDIILGVVSPKPGANIKVYPVDPPQTVMRKQYAAAFTQAQTEEGRGELVLNVSRDGKTMPVTLKLKVWGGFSDTSPYDCPKTQALIDAACADILQRGFFNEKGDENGGIPSLLDALGLLATGQAKYLPAVREYAHAIGDPNVKLDIENSSTWFWSYKLLFLTEYFLATSDEYVLPAIDEYATKIALGQSGVGTWSHGMAKPSENGGRFYGHPSSYGAMNQCSLTCAIGLVLAQKCGITNDTVNAAVKRSIDFYRWYIHHGGIPYGDHEPTMDYNNNGKDGQTAVFFNLIGDKEGTRFFSKMALSGYPKMESGHTGHFFNSLWSTLGASQGGPKAIQSFAENTRWLTEFERGANGGSQYQQSPYKNGEHLKYIRGLDSGNRVGWSTTGVRLLHNCLPRQKLFITGRGGSCIEQFDDEAIASTQLAANFDPKQYRVPQLLALLSHWSPVLRMQVAQELSERDQNVVEELLAMLDSPDPTTRYGACVGLQFAGRQSPEAVDKLLKVVRDSDDFTMRYFAAMAFRISRVHVPGRWEQVKNGLVTLESKNEKITHALLKLASQYEPDKDPQQRLQNLIAATLFYKGSVQPYTGYLPNGEGLEKVDRDVLIPAVKQLLKNPNAYARGSTSRIYDNLTEDDLKKLWGDIYYATKYEAPSGTMAGGVPREYGVKLMAKRRVKEGIDVTIEWAFGQPGWGLEQRLKPGVEALLLYGQHVSPLLPQIHDIVEAHATGVNLVARRNVDTYRQYFEDLKARLTNVNPELVSIQPYIDATPDPLKNQDKP